MPRPKLPTALRTAVASCSRRRCCICFGLDGDITQKRGQFAHVDHDPSNNSFDNIVYLCLAHHDEYDSKTSQSASIGPDELRRYRQELYDCVERRLEAFRHERERVLNAVEYWTFKTGPTKVEIDAALDFFAGPHRTRAVMMLLDDSPKTLSEIQKAVPGNLEWIGTIAEAVVDSGWAFRPAMAGGQYRISDAGERMLRILDAIPDFIKEAAWKANWQPEWAE